MRVLPLGNFKLQSTLMKRMKLDDADGRRGTWRGGNVGVCGNVSENVGMANLVVCQVTCMS